VVLWCGQGVPHIISFVITISETFDIGMDTRRPVDDNHYQVPFASTCTFGRMTFKLGPMRLIEDERGVMHASLLAAKD
jgi:hypothetical protein